jgi:hypothetical protein
MVSIHPIFNFKYYITVIVTFFTPITVLCTTMLKMGSLNLLSSVKPDPYSDIFLNIESFKVFHYHFNLTLFLSQIKPHG